ncbi:MAG: tRNA pseudouridine(55) synthase TruB [Clostridia bacterium]|nr:tRNA pseudouridine(55) synthase TruB [Clostridia bacterium]
MIGLLLVNKPENITSFGAVARIKRLANERRVGHTGTLDPMATGVLPVFLGRATALSSYLLEADKTYTARIRLGVTTDTDDITGNVLCDRREEIKNAFTEEDINKVLDSFLGKQLQTPPMFSAIKKDGVRMYALARQGKTVEIEPRQVEILEIALRSPVEDNEFDISVRVSKGTYIRSLCRDIGERLGCGATLAALSRTNASGIDISSCVKLEDLTEENIGKFIISEEKAVEYLPRVNITEKQAIRFSNGGQLDLDRLKLTEVEDGDLYRVKYNDLFLGLGVIEKEKNQLAIKCIINNI